MKIRAFTYYIFLPTLLLLALLLFLFFFSGHSEGKIVLNKEIKAPLFKNYHTSKILLFFGYVGCMDVCSPKLEELASIYQQLTSIEKKELTLLFINLTPLEDPTTVQHFAQAFHTDFQGLYLDARELQEVQKAFDVYIAPSLAQKGAFDHSAFVYLLQEGTKGYNLNTIYTDAVLSQKLILKDLKS